MGALNLLDRFMDDYEGGHPVEYALPIVPGSRKAKEIDRIMGGVGRHLRRKGKESESAIRRNLRRNGFDESDFETVKRDYQRFLRENADADDNYSMMIDAGALNDVMSGDGRFKNQFETGTSRGWLAQDVRASSSKDKFGTRFKERILDDAYEDDAGNILLKNVPKSLVDSEKFGYAPLYSGYTPKAYGEYRVDFSPENMRGRTSMTLDDSLDIGEYSALLGDESTWGSLVGNKTFIDEGNYGLGSDRTNLYDYAVERLNREAYNNGNRNPVYNELQFHGPLDLGDVDRVYMANGMGIDDIPDQWKMQAEINHFDIVDNDGNTLYKWGNK